MACLFLIELEIEYKGVDLVCFYKTWLEEVRYYLSLKEEGKVKHLWKAVGERKVYIVIEECPTELDKLLFTTPLIKCMGDQVKARVTSLLQYETFANNINEIRGEDGRYDIIEHPRKEGGFYYWLTFDIGHTGQTYDDFLRIWSEEAYVAIKMAKPAGSAVDLWKCVGERRVHVLLRKESAEDVDKITFRLPLMKQNGSNVELKVHSVVPFETLAESLSL